VRHGADDRVSYTSPGKRLGDVGHQQRRLAGCAADLPDRDSKMLEQAGEGAEVDH